MTATLETGVSAGVIPSETDKQAHGAASQVVSFRLSTEEYGLNIMAVQEIILMGEITDIPEVPEYICGLINLRGKVIPIVDLRIRFGLDASASNEHTRIIVVNSQDHSKTFGIVVDAVNEVLRIESSQIEPPPKGITGMDSAFIKGLVKMEQKIMILLDIEKIMAEDEISADKMTPTA